MISYREIFLMFLRFGCLAWGGPVAQIGMIHQEVVVRRGWVPEEQFRRTLALYQALPGPEAHELCVYFGMTQRGRWGGLLAGLGFMLPGLVLMLALSWAYMSWGAQALLPLFVGLAPAVAAIVIRAAQRIAQHSLHSRPLWGLAALSVVLTMLGVHFLYLFALSAAAQSLWAAGRRMAAIILLAVSVIIVLALSPMFPAMPLPDHWGQAGLFLEGLKGGLLSFGGAYTILPLFEQSMVGTYPAITPQSFLDGIALSNVIPAPTVIFGTYLGFLAGGFGGAMWMTLGIFLPAFAVTLIGHHAMEKLVHNPALHGALDGVAAAVIGLLAVTAMQILLMSVTTPHAVLIFALMLIGLYHWHARYAIPAMLLVCAVLGYGLSVML